MKNRVIRSRGERGAALVEGALVFMIVFLTLIGIMEFGRMVWIYDTLAELSREGNRFVACHGSASGTVADTASVRAAVLPYATGLDPNSLTVSFTCNPAGCDTKSQITVTVSYPFTAITPFVPSLNMTSVSRGYVGF